MTSLPAVSTDAPSRDAALAAPEEIAATFRARFCATTGIPVPNFERILFFDCAPQRVRLVRVLYDNSEMNLFASDRELIARVGNARYLAEVDAAIAEYRGRPGGQPWTPRDARLQISTRRLRRIARKYLPKPPRKAEDTAPPCSSQPVLTPAPLSPATPK